jgi:uncharacterized membrane protein
VVIPVSWPAGLPGVTFVRPEWLLALGVIPLLFLFWRLWPPPLQRRRAQVSLALRIVVTLLLVLALAGLRVTVQPQQRAVIAVVDLSASTRHSIDTEAAAVRQLQAGRGADDLFGVVTFAHGAAVELPPTRNPNFESFETQPDPTYTDISGALQLAAGLAPDGYARQLVLVTDGRQNLGDAAITIAALRAEGVRIDVLPTGEAPGAEVLVLGVDAPSQLRAGEHATATVRLRSTSPAKARLVLQVDGNDVETRDVAIPAGASDQAFNLPALDAGLHRVHAELSDPAPDTYSDNNVGEAAIKVLGQPSILVIEGAQGAANNVVSALTSGGMRVDRRLAAQAPVDTATLGKYDSVVVVDVAADQFPAGSMDAIEASVRSLGHGLVTIGGANAYGPGGWQNTGLEKALPVRMDLPPRQEKPHVAVVFVLESLENPSLEPITTGAVESVIDKLTPEDEVGITQATNARSQFLIPLTHVTDPKGLEKQFRDNYQPGDSEYYPYLQAAGQALLKSDAPLKHIVIMGDGDEIREDSPRYQALIQGFKQQGITTSAIGIDTHHSGVFMANMQDLAKWGGGRFYETEDPDSVPQLFLKESQTALRPWFEQTPFFPKVTAAGDLLAGVPLDAFPQLGGYVTTTAKPGSEVYFTSPKDDPVLAAWQYGLGRSVAWTPDAAGRWTAGFLRSDVSAKLFQRMVAWSLPTASDERLKVTAKVAGDQLQLSVSGPSEAGAALDVGAVLPDLRSESVTLSASAPGTWTGHLPADAVGTYLLRVVLHRGSLVDAQSEVAVVVPYSPEYVDLGRDDAALKAFAQVGGSLLTRPAQAWREPALPVPTSTAIFWALLIIAVLLWPLDIALRRLTMTAGQAAEAVAAIASFRRPAAVEVEAPPELARLRARIAPYRRRRNQPAEPPTVVGVGTAEAPSSGGEQTVKKREADAEAEAEALSARLLEARRKRRGSGE